MDASIRRFSGGNFREVLAEREEWLARQVPVGGTREYIKSLLPWQSRGIGDRSMEHHYNMRLEWGRYLGHISQDRALTHDGRELARLVVGVESQNGTFRVGPQS